jgi:hypothetical protein
MSNNNYKKILAIGALMVPLVATSAPLNDFTFKSPAFNGNGYGTYVLTIENEEYTRQQSINQAIQAAAQTAASNAANTPINQFLTNLESRIYAQISQNTATAMFSGSSSTCVSTAACTFQFDASTSISWYWSGTNIVMQVVQPSGTSNITIPTGSFNMQ